MRVLTTLALCLPVALTGCTLTSTAPPSAVTGATIQGRIHGGPQPVVGAAVYLYAANTGGYGGNGLAATTGNASVSLLTSSVLTNNPVQSGIDANGNYYVLTDATGSFTISSDYTCTPGQQVYLYGIGGNPGAGINSAAGFLDLLGACPAAGNFAATTPYIWMNEVSTIAAAYAFSGFATDATHVSSSGTALAQTGIANAFLNASNLVSTSTGTALATTPAVNGGNGTVPQSTINTLANILAACVSSTGPTSSACSTLFADDTSNGIPTGTSGAGTQPTDTATAAINLAHHPYTADVTALFNIVGATAVPYQPALTAAPNAFDIVITFTYPGVASSALGSLAIDQTGDVWITNPGANSVSKLASFGAVLSGSGYTGGLNAPASIAVDDSSNLWIGNLGSGSGVTKLSGSGAVLSDSGNGPYTGGGLYEPQSIAMDASGNAWIVNSSGNGTNSVTELSTSGTVLSDSGNGPYTAGLSFPYNVAIDGSGDAWITNGSNSVTKLSSSGAVLSGSGSGPYAAGGYLNSPVAIAIDGSGNAWIVSEQNSSVVELSNSGVVLSNSGNGAYTGGGMDYPIAIAIDGSGNACISSFQGKTITEFSNPGTLLSGPAGYQAPYPAAVAVDGSGNVWALSGEVGSVIEFVGIATPVVTPISAGLPATPTVNGSSNLGTRP